MVMKKTRIQQCTPLITWGIFSDESCIFWGRRATFLILLYITSYDFVNKMFRILC
jgi:hypothetical protein